MIDYFFFSRTEYFGQLWTFCMSDALELTTWKIFRKRTQHVSCMLCFDRMSIYRHGAPSSVEGDPEFKSAKFKSLMKTVNIQRRPCPSRWHNQVEIVERKKQCRKTTMQRFLAQTATLQPAPIRNARESHQSVRLQSFSTGNDLKRIIKFQ